MERSEATKELLRETGEALSGSARRRFMARSVQALGRRGVGAAGGGLVGGDDPEGNTRTGFRSGYRYLIWRFDLNSN